MKIMEIFQQIASRGFRKPSCYEQRRKLHGEYRVNNKRAHSNQLKGRNKEEKNTPFKKKKEELLRN